MKTIRENYNRTQYRNQRNTVSPAVKDTSTMQLLHLSLREHQRRGNGKIVRVRGPGRLLRICNSFKSLPNQDLNSDNILDMLTQRWGNPKFQLLNEGLQATNDY